MDISDPDLAYIADRALVTPEDADWLEGLADAPRAERTQALARLRADLASVDRRTLHVAGLGLARLGRADEAIAAFERASSLDPADIVDVVNTAVGLTAIGETERARQRLAAVARGDNGMGEVACQYLAEIEHIHERAEREMRFAELRVAALRKRVDAGTATTEELVQLSRSMAHLVVAGREGYDWAGVIKTLETVREREPRNAQALELLIGAYLAAGQYSAMDEVERDLEKVAPESPILDALDFRPENRELYDESMQVRVDHLLTTVICGETEADEAVRSLRTLVQRFPLNDLYHMAYMTALSFVSDVPGALAQAEWLAARPNPTHELHFIVAEVFSCAGDQRRAEAHFREAHRMARTPRDRQDALDRLARLGIRDA